MSEIRLVRPTNEYADAIMEYKKEVLEAGGSLDGCSNLRDCETAMDWIQDVHLAEKVDTCPENKVPANTYLAIRIEDDRLVGVIDLRHHIDHPILSVWGGHIGYSVRPSERRKGYAKEMLRQNLINCKNLGLEKVLITCDTTNTGSRKTILANGGQFEKEITIDGDKLQRYWVYL